jgi:hypothetical protein
MTSLGSNILVGVKPRQVKHKSRSLSDRSSFGESSAELLAELPVKSRRLGPRGNDSK